MGQLEHVLIDLKSVGIEPYLTDEGKLRYRGNRAAMTDARESAIGRVHAELIAHLKTVRRKALGQESLDTFAASDRVVRIHSEVLDCLVLLAGRKADVRSYCAARGIGEDVVCYQGDELRLLLDIASDDELRIMHETKSAFMDTGARLVAAEKGSAQPALKI